MARNLTGWDAIEELGGEARVKVYNEYTLQSLVTTLRISIYGRTLTQYPRDWWQACRERWLPAFWLERYPVQYNRIDELYPALKGFGNRVIRTHSCDARENEP